MDAVAENHAVFVASSLYTVRKYIFMLSLAKPAAFRVAGALLYVLVFLLPRFFLLGGVRVWLSLAATRRRPGAIIVLLFFRFIL